MKKRIIALVMLVVMAISSFPMTASAKTHWDCLSTSYNTGCATVRLTNPKKKAKIKVSVVSLYPVGIEMRDTSNRVIWSETNSIKTNFMGYGYREYNLGKDHSVYKLYFKSKDGVSSVTVANSGTNCTAI